MVNCIAQQLNADPFFPLSLVDEQARNRPNGSVIHGLENSRTFECHILFAKRDCTPADGFFPEVADDSRRFTVSNDLQNKSAVARPFLAHEIGARAPPGSTPTTAASPSFAEELFKIVPAVGREGMTDERELLGHKDLPALPRICKS